MNVDSSGSDIGELESAGVMLKENEVVEKSIPLLLIEIPTSSPWTCSGTVHATLVELKNIPAAVIEPPNLQVVRPLSWKLLPMIVTVMTPCFITEDGVTAKSRT